MQRKLWPVFPGHGVLTTVAILSGGGTCLKCLNGTTPLTGWNLDWSGAQHYWHCYQCTEKPSACLCSHKGLTYRTLTLAVEQRDIWINCQPEWPKCKRNVIYACYFNKLIILPCIKCNILLVLFSPGSVEADVGWGGKLNSHLMASCFRNICAKNRQNPLILLKVTIDNVRVPFLRHSVRVDASTQNAFAAGVRSAADRAPLSGFGTEMKEEW